jgi:hypothetical protein
MCERVQVSSYDLQCHSALCGAARVLQYVRKLLQSPHWTAERLEVRRVELHIAHRCVDCRCECQPLPLAGLTPANVNLIVLQIVRRAPVHGTFKRLHESVYSSKCNAL